MLLNFNLRPSTELVIRLPTLLIVSKLNIELVANIFSKKMLTNCPNYRGVKDLTTICIFFFTDDNIDNTVYLF